MGQFDDFQHSLALDMDGEGRARRRMFAREGSALRRATQGNPRNLPCPQCGEANTLTPKDVALHYICDHCADAAERRYP